MNARWKNPYFTKEDECLYIRQKALGVLPNNDEDEENRFNLLKEMMLKIIHLSESEINESVEEEDTDSAENRKKKTVRKRKRVRNRSNGDRTIHLTGRTGEDMGKEHVESSKSRRLKSCSKPPKPFEFKMSSSRRVKQKDADENNAERKEGAKLKYRRRLITRNVITCRENCCDSQTLVSKATDVKDQSEKRTFSFLQVNKPTFTELA
ncbi:uncharacterized protein LOC143227955 [Tachypleus tridentatus]|uniref:uncharacterized protein LOC143227955 n=1 Tax=Tachypleus tridentatus TaxID=6853 RepID=UPI003FD0C5E8